MRSALAPLALALTLACGHARPRPAPPSCAVTGHDGVAILGAVASPAKVDAAGATLADGLALAGGITALGMRRGIHLRRVTASGARSMSIDADRDAELRLCAGDVVLVPAGGD